SAFGGDADQALGRHAAGLLGGGGEALLAQPVDRLFLVAAGLNQRLLAIHHSGSGDLAQLLDQRRSNLGHVLVLSAYSSQSSRLEARAVRAYVAMGRCAAPPSTPSGQPNEGLRRWPPGPLPRPGSAGLRPAALPPRRYPCRGRSPPAA